MIILDKDIFAWNRADVNRMTVAVVYPQVKSRTIASEYLCFLQASDQLSDSVSRSDVLLRKTSGADQWNQFKTDLTGSLRWFPVGTDRISWLRKWIRALKAVVFHWCCVVVVFAFRHRHNFFFYIAVVFVVFREVPTGSPSRGGDVTVLDINLPSLPTLFISFLCLFLPLWTFQLYSVP